MLVWAKCSMPVKLGHWQSQTSSVCSRMTGQWSDRSAMPSHKTLSPSSPVSYLHSLALRIWISSWRREDHAGMDTWNAPRVTYRSMESVGLGGPRWHRSSWQGGIAQSGISRLWTLMIDTPGDLVWDLPCVQQASYLEGGTLLWMLPLYIIIRFLINMLVQGQHLHPFLLCLCRQTGIVDWHQLSDEAIHNPLQDFHDLLCQLEAAVVSPFQCIPFHCNPCRGRQWNSAPNQRVPCQQLNDSSCEVTNHEGTHLTGCSYHLHHHAWWAWGFARLHLIDSQILIISMIIGMGGPSTGGSSDWRSGSQSNSLLRSLW